MLKIRFFTFFGIFLFILIAYSAKAECVYDGEVFHIKDEPENTLSPIHRLYNTKTGVHLYTKSVTDANWVLGKWPEFEFTDGTPAFCASLTDDGNTPIYRLFNTKTGIHLYTRGKADRDYVLSKWPEFEFTDGVPAFYASLEEKTGLTPIYRLYNTKTGVHLYTRGAADRDYVLSKWPEFEFTDDVPAFYVHTTTDVGPTLFRYQGPEIKIGLYEYTESELEENSFRIESDKSYIIKNKSGAKIATIAAGEQTRVKYLNDDDHTFRIYNSLDPEITAVDEIYFEAANANHTDMIFTIDRPEMTYAKYRGRISLRYSNDDSTKRIWMINHIALEQYTWAMGEITGTGPMEYNKLMTTAYRTYGYWKILESVQYIAQGFNVNATPGNQLYRGYEWEEKYPRIREAAQATRGKIVMHDNEVALTPYSSWTDGRTRDPEEIGWDAGTFPHCRSVDDPYGDYNGEYWDNSTYKSTSTLRAEGNHMVGVSAHGALTLAHDKDWNWDKIMKYYYHDITISPIY